MKDLNSWEPAIGGKIKVAHATAEHIIPSIFSHQSQDTISAVWVQLLGREMK